MGLGSGIAKEAMTAFTWSACERGVGSWVSWSWTEGYKVSQWDLKVMLGIFSEVTMTIHLVEGKSESAELPFVSCSAGAKGKSPEVRYPGSNQYDVPESGDVLRAAS